MIRSQPPCNCTGQHYANSSRGGSPISLWYCSRHGNVFDEDVPIAVPKLTYIQELILKTIHDEHHAGRSAGIDDLSRRLNLSTAAVRIACEILQSLSLIERRVP